MSHDTLLLLCAAAAVAIVVGLIVALKMHAFLALTIGSLFMGLASGFGLDKSVASFIKGFGGTLGSVGLVLALGTMLGKLLAESGGASQIASTVLGRTGARGVPWAMALIAMIVGIPLFFEIGVVLLIPIIFVMAARVTEQAASRAERVDGPARAERVDGPGAATAPNRVLRGSTVILVGIPALAGLSVLHGLVPTR
jgi:GntP family gluconate:H+ symporter